MIYLASSSPRRTELLQQIGVAHECLAIDIDETRLAGESPRDYVQRMAMEKAAAGIALRSQPLPVLAADTTVIIGDECLGKPSDLKEATDMLQRLSGRSHQVFTAVGLQCEQQYFSRLSCSDVHFRDITAEEIAQYWGTGEPLGKAGAYAIQGRAAVFIEQLRGSYSGVMGLPVFETSELLSSAGVCGAFNDH